MVYLYWYESLSLYHWLIKYLDKIGKYRETFFGTPFEVINIPKPNNQAYTADALPNHTDLPYYEYVPGYQFLHCLKNDAEGGSSTAVDGFNVANYLKNTEFRFLSKFWLLFTITWLNKLSNFD